MPMAPIPPVNLKPITSVTMNCTSSKLPTPGSGIGALTLVTNPPWPENGDGVSCLANPKLLPTSP
jgi:hypothetical protein